MIDRSIADLVRGRQLTYLSAEKLDSLFDCLELVCRMRVKGDFAEFGIALGGSSICIASALDGNRNFVRFDVFEQITPPSERDGLEASARYGQIVSGESLGINGNKYYGYTDNIYERVRANFSGAGFVLDGKSIKLIRGLFEQTLPDSSFESISFAHIDCDWYNTVLTFLDFIWTKLSIGGVVILDDYNDWDGCKRATDDFLAKTPDATLCASRPHAIIFCPMARGGLTRPVS